VNASALHREFLIAVLILVPWCPHALALDSSLDVSQYAHTAWKIRDGFPKGYIEAMAQTPDGYLWLGTEFGLIRFDGVRNVPWQPPSGQRLPSNAVRALLTGRDGSLWIGTRKGLASWKDGKLTEYAELAGQDVYSILEDREGAIWIGVFARPVGRLCAIRGTTIQCHGEDGSLGLGPTSLYEDSQGNLWVGTSDGLWKWKPTEPTLFPMPGPDPGVYALLEGDNGEILLGSRHGLLRFIDGRVGPSPVEGGDVLAPHLLRDRDGGLWIGTLHGLLHMHKGHIDSYAQFDGLSGNEITALLEDREGSVWIATIDGLDRFREFAIPTIFSAQGLPDSTLSSVVATRDGIWVGGSGGLSRWKDGEITTYRKQRHVTELVTHNADRATRSQVHEVFDSGLQADSIESLGKDDRDRLWVSTAQGIAHLENGRFVPVREVAGGQFQAIAADRTGDVWISNQTEGLIHVRHEKVAERIAWSTFGANLIAASLMPDGVDGGIWLGFFQGGVAYFKDGQVRATFGPRDGLGNGRVASLYLDDGGTLWAATEGGLSRLRNGGIATLTVSNGLPCDAVHWVAEDDTRSFWLGTACGVVRVARPELDAWASDTKRRINTTVFDSTDGVRSAAIADAYSPHVAKTADGKLWFVTHDGVSVVDPRSLRVNKLSPPVHVEQIVADRKTYEASSQLRLPPLVRDLQIDYTALSFVAPEKMLFRYKLEGRDRDWQDAGNRRQAFYTDLDPGNYRFRVIACNNSGVWNEEGATLDFSIAPAYWQTNWFRALCVAVFIALLWALYRLRLRQIAQGFNARLEERVGERTRIARDLHDTLLQSFQGLLLRFQTVYELLPTRPTEAKKVLESAIDQTAQAINEGRDAVQGLRASTVETNDLAVAITRLGEELAAEAGDQTAAGMRVEVEGEPRTLQPIVRDEVYRIASEALRNAFRHAEAKQIEVELRYDVRQLRLRIRDDGKGIDREHLSAEGRAGHFGLHGMRERARLMGGKLTIWTAPGSGTEIELSVPAAHAYVASAAPGRSWFAEKLLGKSAKVEP
jgi:signal transduction histidine kinase/ligand-binding sensor domain-containing protein